MATKTVIDSKIKRGNTTYTKIQVGSTPVYRIVAGGNISYDRKDYEFTVASGTLYIPVGGGNRYNDIAAKVTTSKYTGYTDSNVKVVGASAA